jgi:hypothetical protein
MEGETKQQTSETVNERSEVTFFDIEGATSSTIAFILPSSSQSKTVGIMELHRPQAMQASLSIRTFLGPIQFLLKTHYNQLALSSKCLIRNFLTMFLLVFHLK